jgi:hypothetical protein
MLFTEDGTITKQAAYTLIDSVKPGTVFYKVILSPDPSREDTRRDLDLWQLTDQLSGHPRMHLGGSDRRMPSVR